MFICFPVCPEVFRWWWFLKAWSLCTRVLTIISCIGRTEMSRGNIEITEQTLKKNVIRTQWSTLATHVGH